MGLITRNKYQQQQQKKLKRYTLEQTAYVNSIINNTFLIFFFLNAMFCNYHKSRLVLFFFKPQKSSSFLSFFSLNNIQLGRRTVRTGKRDKRIWNIDQQQEMCTRLDGTCIACNSFDTQLYPISRLFSSDNCYSRENVSQTQRWCQNNFKLFKD